MKFLSLLEAKRDGQELSPGQLEEAIVAYTAGRIPDYQMAAFLMAVYFRGLNLVETAALTLAMRDSGEVLDLPADRRPLVDKHSTGGVGDKVSLSLAPLLACLGFRVPMISGRGLGITGGTLDKLDSIPGFKTVLSRERIGQIVQAVGCVICGQTETMVPADKRLYALRDVTGTVPSVPLIVASILSKKLAEGLGALILDVKFGAAAFMPTRDKARELAQAMVTLGTRCGVNTRALITNMDAPLGRAVGNWLEVKEALALLESRDAFHRVPNDTLECVRGGTRPNSAQWPKGQSSGSQERISNQSRDDLKELVVTCAAHLLVQTGRTGDLSAAHKEADQCLFSGEPRKKWDELLLAQGADLEAFNRKLEKATCVPVVKELRATRDGFVSRSDARLMGEIVRDLGAGRFLKDSPIDYDTGLDQIAKPGDRVVAGSVLARIHGRNEATLQSAQERLASAFEIFPAQGPQAPLVAEVIG